MDNVYRDSLDVIFRKVSPEFVKNRFLKILEKNEELPVSVRGFQSEVFYKYSHQSFENLTWDELENVHDFMMRASEEYDGTGKRFNLFRLLTGFTKNILEISHGDPVCEKEYILRWRDIAFRLGQDIFTTAHLAGQDQEIGRRRTYFGWPAVIRSNDPKIRELMKQGMAENHYHLYGSVPIFQLSWISLMNHPQDSEAFQKERERERERFRKFQENLNPELLQSHEDYQLPWADRIKLAAWIRVKLFLHIMEVEEGVPVNEVKFSDMNSFMAEQGNQNRKLCHLAEQARFFYGKQVSLSNGKRKCLDYAYTNLLDDRCNEGYHRLLVGERYFLYTCFYFCFAEDGRFTEGEMNLFYLYLLLKVHFRDEMIQTNRRIGFHNFSEYQGRKTMFWGKYREYWGEAYRMAINGAIRDNKLNSLELRIMPKMRRKDFMNNIFRIDREVCFARETYPGDGDGYSTPCKDQVLSFGKNGEYFYVIHFPKRKLKKVDESTVREMDAMGFIPPRNIDVRRKSRSQALALAKALLGHGYLCMRIRGIDGCSAEIGCRPETFATEFRFLRNFASVQTMGKPLRGESDVEPLLSASYHVGEDFLEVADGLRAIDEAVYFLNLQRGDRLGHALALGIHAEQYYRIKKNHFILSKQNRLDDLVWLLFRSRELSVPLPADLEAEIRKEAKELLHDIYGGSIRLNGWTEDLQSYYESWQLRGDHPSLYKKKDFSEMGKEIRIESLAGAYLSIKNQYETFKKNKSISVILNECNCGLVFYYHFGYEERKKGQELVPVKIKRDYVELMAKMQEGMIRELVRRGIAIECNPSSNVLIGTVERYEDHPIFRFNHSYLQDKYGTLQNGYGNNCGWNSDNGYELCVSVNTDDQGIFDTSLENEYTLLARCLEKQKDEDGTPRYNPSVIWDYLKYLRSMGEMQVFPKSFQSKEESWK